MPEQNVYQLKDLLHLWPSSQNQQFGDDMFELASLFMGGGRTVQKVNLKRYEEAKEAVSLLRSIVKRLKATPNKTPATHDAVRIVEGRLKQAEEAMRKSEIHTRIGQGPR